MEFYTSFHPKIPGDIPFILGPYFILSLWILKLTYGKSTLYLLTNAIGHVLFAFSGIKLLKRLGIVSLIQMKSIQLTLLLTIRGVLLKVLVLQRNKAATLPNGSIYQD